MSKYLIQEKKQKVEAFSLHHKQVALGWEFFVFFFSERFVFVLSVFFLEDAKEALNSLQRFVTNMTELLNVSSLFSFFSYQLSIVQKSDSPKTAEAVEHCATKVADSLGNKYTETTYPQNEVC